MEVLDISATTHTHTHLTDVLPLVYNALESEHAIVSLVTPVLAAIVEEKIGPRTRTEGCAQPLRDYRLGGGTRGTLP